MSKCLKRIRSVYDSHRHWLSWPKCLGILVLTYVAIGLTMTMMETNLKKPLIIVLALIAGLVIDGCILIFIFKQRKFHLNMPKLKYGHEVKRVAESLAFILFGGGLLQGIIIGLGKALGPYNAHQHLSTNQTILDHIMSTNHFALISMVIMGIIIAPLIEEFIFRALIIGPRYNEIKKPRSKKTDRMVMLIISIILFTAIHVINQSMPTDYTGIIQTISDVARYGTMATVFGIAYYQSGNIFDSLSMHITWNALSFGATLAVLL